MPLNLNKALYIEDRQYLFLACMNELKIWTLEVYEPINLLCIIV